MPLIFLAHDSLGTADEIIPAVLAAILLVGVLMTSAADYWKAKKRHANPSDEQQES